MPGGCRPRTGLFVPPTQPVDRKLGEPDAHPVGTIRAIKDEDAVAHIGSLSAIFIMLMTNAPEG